MRFICRYSNLVVVLGVALSISFPISASAESLIRNLKAMFPLLAEILPAEYIPVTAVRYVRAQSNGSGSENGSMTLFYNTISTNPTAVPPSCPSGWSMQIMGPGANTEGYGPHYIGLLAYDWLQGGTGGTGGGFGSPSGGTPPSYPFPPIGGGPGLPWPPMPGGGGGGEPPVIVTDSPNYGDPPVMEVPPLSEPEPWVPDAPDEGAGGAAIINPNFFERLINKALAQGLTNQYIASIGIGSDSTCSQSATEVVPIGTVYLNTYYSPALSMNSRACYTDSATGITECNRCRVCYK